MRRRLLFVDDEPLILDALRRALRGMHHEWEMTFVTSASAALAELNREGCDAVVTDMRMPEMDGAELLHEVQKRYPKTVRIVLSGQSHADAILRSIDPAHQFLSKPCDIEELKRRLSLAFSMRDLVTNSALGATVTKLQSIPSHPFVYSELMKALGSNIASLKQIEKIISGDAALATRTLQLANSAFIGASGQVSSLQKAVSLIGTETLRTLALALHVFSRFKGNPKASKYLSALWEHSLEVVYLARQIALKGNYPASLAEQTSTAAIIHDVGIAVLLAEMPDEYAKAFKSAKDDIPQVSLEQERQTFGCTHAQVGAYLLSIWGLPSTLVYAVGLHHSPSADLQAQFSPLTAVYLADAVINRDPENAFEQCEDLDLRYLERFGIGPDIGEWEKVYKDSKKRHERTGT